MTLEQSTNPDLTFQVIGGAIEVHRRLGPGLLESTYRTCLQHELASRGFRVAGEVPIPLEYKGVPLDSSYRADLIVEELVLVELKAVDQLLPIHAMQVVTYLRLTGLKSGLLLNFNVPCLKNGVRRFANSAKPADRSARAFPRTLSNVDDHGRTVTAPP